MSHPVGRCICKDEPVDGHQGRQNEGVWRLRRLKELPVARARHFRRLRRRASRRRGEQEAEQQNEDASHHVRGSCLPCGCLSFPPNPSHREIRLQSRRIVAKHTRGRQTPRARAPPLLPLLPHPSSPRAALQPSSLSLALSLAHRPWGVTAVERKNAGCGREGQGPPKMEILGTRQDRSMETRNE